MLIIGTEWCGLISFKLCCRTKEEEMFGGRKNKTPFCWHLSVLHNDIGTSPALLTVLAPGMAASCRQPPSILCGHYYISVLWLLWQATGVRLALVGHPVSNNSLDVKGSLTQQLQDSGEHGVDLPVCIWGEYESVWKQAKKKDVNK